MFKDFIGLNPEELFSLKKAPVYVEWFLIVLFETVYQIWTKISM